MAHRHKPHHHHNHEHHVVGKGGKKKKSKKCRFVGSAQNGYHNLIFFSFTSAMKKKNDVNCVVFSLLLLLFCAAFDWRGREPESRAIHEQQHTSL